MKKLQDGHLQENDFEALRPAPADAVMPYDADKICGRTISHAKVAGEHLKLFDSKVYFLLVLH